MGQSLELLGMKGCGSAIAEAFLILAEIPFERKEVDYDRPGPERDDLFAKNPLGQVPTLVLENGTILTETLAVAHHVHDVRPELGLLPKAIADRVLFFRWSTFIISSIYPCFTYGDDPKKWIRNDLVAPELKTATTENLKKLWLVMEEQCAGPYFLASGLSAIDIYLKVMTHWRPGKAWFKSNCPSIMRVAERVSAIPALQKLWNDNFDS